jgi:hypothetical protein
MFKGTPPDGRKVWLVNKADDENQVEQAAAVAEYILKESAVPDMVLIASVNQDDPVKMVCTRL